MDEPLVSICCLTYNHAPYIRQCLDGFMMQKTDFLFEVLIHDDASTDNTQKIIREYVQKYPDIIKPIYQKENQYSKGVKVTFNYQFPRAKGKYISFCEGDDYWVDPEKLQKQVDFLELNNAYGLIFTDTSFYYQDSKRLVSSVFENKHMNLYTNFDDFLINTGYAAPCTWVCRREFLPKFDGKHYVDGTFPWMLDILANSKVKYLPFATTVYRVLPESASHSKLYRIRYKFIKGLHEIQRAYVEKYNLSNDVSSKIDLHYYSKNFPYIVIMEDNSEIMKGRMVLSTASHLSLKISISIFLSRFSAGICLLKFVYTLRDRIL